MAAALSASAEDPHSSLAFPLPPSLAVPSVIRPDRDMKSSPMADAVEQAEQANEIASSRDKLRGLMRAQSIDWDAVRTAQREYYRQKRSASCGNALRLESQRWTSGPAGGGTTILGLGRNASWSDEFAPQPDTHARQRRQHPYRRKKNAHRHQRSATLSSASDIFASAMITKDDAPSPGPEAPGATAEGPARNRKMHRHQRSWSSDAASDVFLRLLAATPNLDRPALGGGIRPPSGGTSGTGGLVLRRPPSHRRQGSVGASVAPNGFGVAVAPLHAGKSNTSINNEDMPAAMAACSTSSNSSGASSTSTTCNPKVTPSSQSSENEITSHHTTNGLVLRKAPSQSHRHRHRHHQRAATIAGSTADDIFMLLDTAERNGTAAEDSTMFSPFAGVVATRPLTALLQREMRGQNDQSAAGISGQQHSSVAATAAEAARQHAAAAERHAAAAREHAAAAERHVLLAAAARQHTSSSGSLGANAA